MNPFLNPITALPLLKKYLLHPKRIYSYSPEKMSRYRNKTLKKLIKYAYTVPLYHDKYKKAGIHPDDINGIKDITRLPIVSKKDMIDYYPDGIIPKNYKIEKAHVVCTSGSTGKPVSIFTDFNTYMGYMILVIRGLKVLNLNWRKDKMVHIGNFSPNKLDSATKKLVSANLNSIIKMDNHLSINNFDPINEIIKKLDDFQPDMVCSYPVTFKSLAHFKNKGYGKNINPKALTVGGYVLDDYTKAYVEEAFNCGLYNVYASAESSADIAFECLSHTWHINYDYYHVEAVDEGMNLVNEGEKGHIILTRMFGKGTPIIRYSGMDDWITIENNFECDCGLKTPILKYGVEGRLSTSVILPDGRIFPSASFAIISVILNEMKTRKVIQFQIVQRKIDQIDVLIVIDDELRDTDPPDDVLIKKIKDIYQEKVGPKVTINVKEVKGIKSEPGKPSPLVISKINPNKAYDMIESKD